MIGKKAQRTKKIIMNIIIYICTLFFLIPFTMCSQDFFLQAPYNFNRPVKTIELPSELEEISGLSMTADGQSLYAVQDELGVVFILNRVDGNILNRIKFGPSGDFEGVEAVGDYVWVVKSNGNLYRIKPGKESALAVLKFDTDIEKDADIEGLTYDPVKKHLLIACKEKSGVKGIDDDEVRAIYAFDPELGEMISTDPVLMVEQEKIRSFIDKNELSDVDELEELAEEKEITFLPSGIAVNPLDDHFYIISSTGRAIIILSRKGEIKHISPLKKKVHRQPEGITFDKLGNLFISNESKKDEPAKLLMFPPL